jgi:ribose transport system substrate-binding protein
MTLALVVGACSGSATTAPAASTAPASAAAPASSAAGAASAYTPPTDAGKAKGKTIAIISKGEQHQFWQAVKKGALDEAAKLGVTATYQGPATES